MYQGLWEVFQMGGETFPCVSVSARLEAGRGERVHWYIIAGVSLRNFCEV